MTLLETLAAWLPEQRWYATKGLAPQLRILASIALLVLLISWGKIHPFIAFLLTSIFAGWVLGLPLEAIPRSIEKGLGGMLGSLVAIIALGLQ